MTLLEVDQLRAGYGHVNVLHDLDLTVDEAEIVVVLGANGAGKTTTMRAISGTIPRSGAISFNGTPITNSSADSIVRAGIAQVPQGRGTFPELTVDDNLRIGAYTRRDGDVAADIERWYGTFPRLAERRDQRAGSLSGGEQQMLAIARALMSRPKLLLCDEPSLGLAPLITQELFGIIATISQEGIAVLLVEQNAQLAMKIAHRVYLLETGRIVASGDAETIAADDSIRKAYLGVLMDRFFDALFLGLSSGSVYALVALSLVVVFRGTGHLNFAQGEMATLSAYITWIFAFDHGVTLVVATLIGMAFGFLLGATVEITLIRPLAKKSPLAVFVATIALFLGINALTTGIWGAPPDEALDSLFPNDPEDFWRVAGTVWRYQNIGIFITTLVITGLLFLLFQKARFGLAMRGVASNPDSARLVGIPTGRILAGSWGISGALGALAGVMVAGLQGQVTPTLMVSVFVYASAAAVLGGLDSPGGAVIAGLSIGIIENMAAEFSQVWVGQDMKLAVALGCIFVVLLFKPSGLFGTSKVERV